MPTGIGTAYKVLAIDFQNVAEKIDYFDGFLV